MHAHAHGACACPTPRAFDGPPPPPRRAPGPQARRARQHPAPLSKWSDRLEADIRAVAMEAGLPANAAASVVDAARRGSVAANPGVLLGQVGAAAGGGVGFVPWHSGARMGAIGGHVGAPVLPACAWACLGLPARGCTPSRTASLLPPRLPPPPPSCSSWACSPRWTRPWGGARRCAWCAPCPRCSTRRPTRWRGTWRSWARRLGRAARPRWWPSACVRGCVQALGCKWGAGALRCARSSRLPTPTGAACTGPPAVVPHAPPTRRAPFLLNIAPFTVWARLSQLQELLGTTLARTQVRRQGARAEGGWEGWQRCSARCKPCVPAAAAPAPLLPLRPRAGHCGAPAALACHRARCAGVAAGGAAGPGQVGRALVVARRLQGWRFGG